MPVDRDKLEAEVLYQELRREPKTPEELEAEIAQLTPPLGVFTAGLRDEFRGEAEAEHAEREKQTDELWRG